MEAVAACEIAGGDGLEAEDERLCDGRVADGHDSIFLSIGGSGKVLLEESDGLAAVVLGALLPFVFRSLLVRDETAAG